MTDPALATPDSAISEIARLQGRGEYFQLYDLAAKAAELFPQDWRFGYRAVLALARAGATELAERKYHEYRLGDVPATDARALAARLSKDRALRLPAGPERREALLAAAAAYERIYTATRSTPGGDPTFPAINAATLYCLAGEDQQAQALAGQVMALLGPLPVNPPLLAGQYWPLATAVEALLVLDRWDEAQALVRPTLQAVGANWADLGTTLKQIRQIFAHRGTTPLWAGELRPPTVLTYTGHIIAAPGKPGRFPAAHEERVRARIEAALERRRVGFAYGALAAGSDILFAETVLNRGGLLEVVLPCDEREFIDLSVRPAGEHWVERYLACRNHRNANTRFANSDHLLGDDTLFSYAARLAMGLACLRARNLTTTAEMIAVWDGHPARGVAGTAVDLTVWNRTGRPLTILPVGDGPPAEPGTNLDHVSAGDTKRLFKRSARAMLFGDFKGFSKLKDREVAVYVREVLGTVAQVLEHHRSRVLFANTWGDGIFIVFKRADEAADLALDLQDAINGLDRRRLNLPDDFSLRLGGHLGPVYCERDPILLRENFFGAHVSRAARVEPVTPPACVYVTETFAASLELDHPNRFACDLVGTTAAAKNYGELRMFLLRRPGGLAGA